MYLYLAVCIYLVRGILFLSGKSQGTLKSNSGGQNSVELMTGNFAKCYFIWNSLPQSLWNITSVDSFKAELKTLLCRQAYKDFVYILSIYI